MIGIQWKNTRTNHPNPNRQGEPSRDFGVHPPASPEPRRHQRAGPHGTACGGRGGARWVCADVVASRSACRDLLLFDVLFFVFFLLCLSFFFLVVCSLLVF